MAVRHHRRGRRPVADEEPVTGGAPRDTAPGELVLPVDAELPVRRAHRDDDQVCGELAVERPSVLDGPAAIDLDDVVGGQGDAAADLVAVPEFSLGHLRAAGVAHADEQGHRVRSRRLDPRAGGLVSSVGGGSTIRFKRVE